ncbi:MAG: hypothetical protein Q9210_005008 [Variospora velana]
MSGGAPSTFENEHAHLQALLFQLSVYQPKASIGTPDMSRSSMAPQRNLTLTEELEKLEQSITLTLQGLDRYLLHAEDIN